MAGIYISTSRNLLVILFILFLIGIVAAESEYCNQSENTTTTIEQTGAWTNITIESDTCPICVNTPIGEQCTYCPGQEPTPTETPPLYPTPTPTETTCVPGMGTWCPLPTPTQICYGIWCFVPTPEPTPAPCWGYWCPV